MERTSQHEGWSNAATRRATQSGMSLAEVMVAFAVLTIVLVALMAVLI